ncbi:MAG: glycine zipper protein [Herminiimonas sp.]|nr:glycine zipper protein [Herminiimonas sp.]
MDVNKTSNRIHPLVAAASVSVMLVSLVGVAAITGVLPNSNSTVTPAAPTESTAPTQSAPLAAGAPTTATESKVATNDVAVPAKPAASALVVKHQKTAKHSSASGSTPDYSQQTTQVAQAPAICHSCGRVESVHAVQTQAKPSGLGVVAGGVVGGLLGNQVGGGNGRTLATVAGAVGGGFAGNEIEKRTHTATTYQVRVRMEDGAVRNFPYNSHPSWSVGDRVKVVDGYLTSRS